MVRFDSDSQAKKVMELSFGRILKLGSRPEQPGDIEDYEKAKGVFLDAAEYLGIKNPKDTGISYARDYITINKD
jgi:hypothetical protein